MRAMDDSPTGSSPVQDSDLFMGFDDRTRGNRNKRPAFDRGMESNDWGSNTVLHCNGGHYTLQQRSYPDGSATRVEAIARSYY